MENYIVNYAPVIKVYKIDYDFIISNYLDVRLWNKSWNLFVFQDVVITICLSLIETKTKTISFELVLTKENQRFTRMIRHNIQNSKISILMKQIDGAMESLINDLEYAMIKRTEAYRNMSVIVQEEHDALYEIASKFLDNNGVTNSEIREVYIDSYIYNNNKAESLLSSFLYGKKYTEMTSLYLVFAEITKDEALKTNITKANTSAKIKDILKDVEEYKKYMQTEDYVIDLTDNLDNL